jgi:hypothetical protein
MKWFDTVRRITTFLLGVAIIIKGLSGDDEATTELIIGMVMVGILPVESLTFWRDGKESSVTQASAPSAPPSAATAATTTTDTVV